LYTSAIVGKEAVMMTVAEVCKDSAAFTYRSIDRLVLNAYIPTLQTPAAMAWFLKHVFGKPFLSPHVFKWLTDRFVEAVKAFAVEQNIPVLRPQGRTRPGEMAQQALRRAARRGRWGVVAIVVHQESARVFGSTPDRRYPGHFRVKEDRRLVNHYYFYLRDTRYGEGFVRISSYPPFQTRIWMNAHGYLTSELRRHRIRFETLDNCIVDVTRPEVLQRIADRFDGDLAERVARRWLSWVPDPLTPKERAAGFPHRFSIYQAEFSDNVIFRRAQVLNRVYEQLLRDHLHLGRPDMLKVIFDRKIQRNTPSDYKTRILRQGVVSCLKVFYKKSFLKQYNKGGRVLRTEVCVNDPGDFKIKKSLVHLGYLGQIAYHAITRFTKAQAVAQSTAIDRSTLERLVAPRREGGNRAAGLRFGAPRAMKVLEALGCAGLSFGAFSNAQLREVLVHRLGASPQEFTPARTAYELRKLRGHGLLRKAERRNRYALTDRGFRVAIGFTKIHQRLLTPGLESFDPHLRALLSHSPHPTDRALARLNHELDGLATICGLEVAA
jgi:hypothetical protein